MLRERNERWMEFIGAVLPAAVPDDDEATWQKNPRFARITQPRGESSRWRRTGDGWMDGSRWGVTPSLRPSASLALCTKWDGDFTIHSHGITHMIKLTLDIRRLGTVWRGVYVQAIWQSV